MSHFRNSTKTEETAELLEITTDVSKLLLYNDDVNTFDHVIKCLVDICNHQPLQAEQCAYLVHFTGKCVVGSGSFDELKDKCIALLNQGLNATIV